MIQLKIVKFINRLSKYLLCQFIE